MRLDLMVRPYFFLPKPILSKRAGFQSPHNLFSPICIETEITVLKSPSASFSEKLAGQLIDWLCLLLA